MGFTVVKNFEGVEGSRRVTSGTYASAGGSTGGDINTGLHTCEEIYLQPVGSAVQGCPALNETLPVAGSAVTIVTDANVSGKWKAYGN